MADGPNIDLIVPRSEEIAPFYQAADQLGFHALWFTEMLFNRTWDGERGWDPFGVLPAAAAFRGFLDAGITTLVLCLVPPDVEHLERLHREVVPLLR